MTSWLAPPCRGTLQGADGRGNGGMDVRQGGHGHPGRKGRGVELMVGMQDESHVQGPLGGCVGLFPGQHIDEVGRVGKPGIGADRFLAIADSVGGGHDGRDLSGQAIGLSQVGRFVVGSCVGIVVGKRRDSRAQDIHGRGVRGQALQQLKHRLRQGPAPTHDRCYFVQVRLLGEAAEPQQVADFLERRMLRQIVDVDAPIGQDPLLSVDPADG